MWPPPVCTSQRRRSTALEYLSAGRYNIVDSATMLGAMSYRVESGTSTRRCPLSSVSYGALRHDRDISHRNGDSRRCRSRY